jgi:multidrug resistance efflux pump
MRRLLRRAVLIPTILIVVFVIAAGAIGYVVYNNENFYSTDEAQITGNIVNITPVTAGTLVDLNVQVGDFVSAKQVIGTVQPTGYLPVQHIVAPMDGVIVQVPGVVGQQVSEQVAVAQETDPTTVKVTAYVDESAIHTIGVGQTSDIHVDAYNNTITGHVTQIVNATAGQFALLPTTDNSSGNFTKVSQRIPIYIKLDTPPDGSLLPGMSVEVTVHLH